MMSYYNTTAVVMKSAYAHHQRKIASPHGRKSEPFYFRKEPVQRNTINIKRKIRCQCDWFV